MVRDECAHKGSLRAIMNFNIPSKALENRPRDGQAYTQALMAAAISLAGLIKTFKYLFAQLRGNARSVILDLYIDTSI